MADIQAFRGIRFDLGRVGALSDVIAPPYDVIGPELQDALYRKHPCNIVRMDLNRDEPGDGPESKYARAARIYNSWRSEGILFEEAQPAVYVYHQEYTVEGQHYLRKGFMARCRVERFGEGRIFPHEETMSGPKQDRLLLTRATKANLSQIFGLYPDPAFEAQSLLETAIVGATPLEATDHLGVVSRIWPVTNLDVIAAVAKAMGPKPIFIADGHHRYETACNYRDEVAAALGGTLPPGHPANFVLMMCIGMNDPGLIVLPTHRLFRGLPQLTSEQLIERLGTLFTTRLIGEGSDLAPSVWEEIASADRQGTIGFFTKRDERWVLASITPAGQARMCELAPEHSEDWRGLGVAILHRLVVENLLEGRRLPKPAYVHLVDEVVEGVETEEYQLAALVMPATVEHIRLLSEHGERMPAKSTYFYPKLLAGLVINPLE